MGTIRFECLRASLLAFSLIILTTFITDAAAQGIAVNPAGTPADASAIFDVSSSDKGMLIPRMTEQQRDSVSNPAEGLVIFNLTSRCFNFFSNGGWFEICGNCIPPPAPVAGTAGAVCAGDTLFLTASHVPNATYLWTGPNGFSSNLQNPFIANASATHSGLYQVQAVRNNCPGPYGGITATVYPIPSASFTASPSQGSVSQNVTFSAAESGASYLWSFQGANPSSSTVQNPVVQWSATGIYSVSLNIIKNGCNASSQQNFTVSNCNPYHTISYNFTTGISTTSGDCNNWSVFRNSLTPGNYCRVMLSGTEFPAGYSCSDPVAVNQIAAFVKNGTVGTIVACDGMNWSNEHQNDWLYVFNNAGNSCTKNACIRPCIGNQNWGGFNTVICNAPTQTITLTFYQ